MFAKALVVLSPSAFPLAKGKELSPACPHITNAKPSGGPRRVIAGEMQAKIRQENSLRIWNRW